MLGESNAALVAGDGASLPVDTLWDPPLTRRMLAAMAPLLADAPIVTLVNSHSDGDHWWGNQEVAGAEIAATQAVERLLALGAERFVALFARNVQNDRRPPGGGRRSAGPGGAGAT